MTCERKRTRSDWARLGTIDYDFCEVRIGIDNESIDNFSTAAYGSTATNTNGPIDNQRGSIEPNTVSGFVPSTGTDYHQRL